MIRQKKSDDNMLSKVDPLQEKNVKDDKVVIKVKNNINPYIPP